VKILRASSREEVVSYYVTGELDRLVEHADVDPELESAALASLIAPANAGEGALQHLSRTLLVIYRKHSWLYDRLYEVQRAWSLIEVTTDEIDMMPMGGEPTSFHYPKLSALVREVKDAAEHRKRIPGINDDPGFLLSPRATALLRTRVILIKGEYASRHFDFALGDGAHRAIYLAATGARYLEAYYGQLF
jgi:hypothetical protein